MKKTISRVIYTILLLAAVTPVVYQLSNYAQKELKLQEQERIVFAAEKTANLSSKDNVKYLLLIKDIDNDNDFSKIGSNLRIAFMYSKLPLDVITWNEWNKAPPDLAPYKHGAVILLAEDQEDLKWTDRLKEYTEQSGGLLVNAWRSLNSPLNDFFGIEGIPYYLRSSGLHWRTKLYPGLSDQDLTVDRLDSSSLDVKLNPEMKVWAESTEPKRIPYIWYGERGKGRVLSWNLSSLGTKLFRGVFVQGVLKAQSISVKGSVGAQVWYIDDFPAPVAIDQVTPTNTSGMTDYKFRLKQWDPDMEHITNKYGIRYSAGVIFNYTDKVTPPFPFPNYEQLFHFESIIAQKGELGLHGYNHQSLELKYSDEQRKLLGYNPWPSTNDIKESLRTVRSNWQKIFKTSLPTMYIPPSNFLSLEGEKALLDIFPELKTISSIYVSNSGAFEQEFLPDPNFPQIMGTPRATYGYIMDTDERFELYSVIANLGIVSHFNHPDDVFDPDRNHGKSWMELRNSFESLVGDVQNKFEWLRPMTATQLSDALRVYHQAQLEINLNEAGVVRVMVSPLKGPFFIEVRIPSHSDWHVKRGGSIIKADKEYGILWIKVDEPEVVLEENR